MVGGTAGVLLRDEIVQHFLRCSSGHRDWLPEISEGEDVGATRRFEPGKRDRKMLRLIANSAVECLQRDPGVREYLNDLAAIVPIRSMDTAARASSKLLKVGAWAEHEYGEQHGDRYFSAGRLAEAVMEHYSEWPGDTYEDVAGHYVTAVGRGFTPEAREPVLRLFNELADVKEH